MMTESNKANINVYYIVYTIHPVPDLIYRQPTKFQATVIKMWSTKKEIFCYLVIKNYNIITFYFWTIRY